MDIRKAIKLAKEQIKPIQRPREVGHRFYPRPLYPAGADSDPVWWFCGRDLGTKDSPNWIFPPMGGHVAMGDTFATDWEIVEDADIVDELRAALERHRIYEEQRELEWERED